ncbi:MAG TPA: Rap1a/Tai family immunity protein [Candidatus Dormibacteraeota bacterium]|nr:Rap1a/Tai family immunity protein [Candidatus Dormibacteraeota bacterium]
MRPLWCPATNVTSEQSTLIVTKYLHDHPESLYGVASVQVVLAFEATWPCHKSGKLRYQNMKTLLIVILLLVSASAMAMYVDQPALASAPAPWDFTYYGDMCSDLLDASDKISPLEHLYYKLTGTFKDSDIYKNCETAYWDSAKAGKQLEDDAMAIADITGDIDWDTKLKTNPPIMDKSWTDEWAAEKAAAEKPGASIVTIATWENDKNKAKDYATLLANEIAHADAQVANDKAVAARWAADKTAAEKPDASITAKKKWALELSAEAYWLKLQPIIMPTFTPLPVTVASPQPVYIVPKPFTSTVPPT